MKNIIPVGTVGGMKHMDSSINDNLVPQMSVCMLIIYLDK